MDEPLQLGILGATGMAGREAVLHQAWLDDSGDQYAELAAVTGSSSSAGRQLGDLFREREQRLGDRYGFWEERSCPDRYRDMTVTATDPAQLADEVDAVISALPSSVAAEVEPGLRERGVHVFSNASAARWDDLVPLMLPSVNPGAIQQVDRQQTAGVQVNNPNCTTAGFVPLLHRLRSHDIGIRDVDVVTLQAISGKGDTVADEEYAAHIRGNAIDDWGGGGGSNGEERKSETEPQKILGTATDRDRVSDEYSRLRQGELSPSEAAIIPVTARTNRIPSQYGHLESLTITVDEAMSEERFSDLLTTPGEEQTTGTLPTSPEHQIVVQDTVEPAEHVFQHDGMAVTAGRIRRTGETEFSLFSLSHNLRLGATWTARHSLELYLQQEHGFFNR